MSSLRSVWRPAARALQRASAAPMTRGMSSTSSRFHRTATLSDEIVLEHLVCPISKSPLRYDAERGSLVCDEINVEYPIWQGVPLLVPSEGRIISSSDHE